MHSVISEDCIDVLDRSCMQVCCVDAIHFERGKDRMAYTDPDECIACYACAAECPVNAIFALSDVGRDADRILPERPVVTSDLKYVELNALWYEDRDAARALVDEWAPPGMERPHHSDLAEMWLRARAAETRRRAEAAEKRPSWLDRLKGR